MSFTVNKLDVVFLQRDTTNTQYEQINISGSNAIFYLDKNGTLTAGRISDILKQDGTTKSSLKSYSRDPLPGETLYSVDTVTVGYPNSFVKYQPDSNNPLSYRVTYTDTWFRDTPNGIGIGKTDEEPFVNATLDVSGTVIISGSLTVTGTIFGTTTNSNTSSVSHVSNTSLTATSSLGADFALLSGHSITSTSASYASSTDVVFSRLFLLMGC